MRDVDSTYLGDKTAHEEWQDYKVSDYMEFEVVGLFKSPQKNWMDIIIPQSYPEEFGSDIPIEKRKYFSPIILLCLKIAEMVKF